MICISEQCTKAKPSNNAIRRRNTSTSITKHIPAQQNLTKAEPAERKPSMRLSIVQGWRRESLECDYAVLGSTHIDPALTQLDIRSSGLEMDEKNGGIVVNAQLEALNNVYVAGSAASYYDQSLGRRRVTLFDHSLNSGLTAGYNMTREFAHSSIDGNCQFYTHQPAFRCSLKDIDVVCEGVGEIDAKYRTVGVWLTQGPAAGECTHCTTADGDVVPMMKGELSGKWTYRRGVIYYLDSGNQIKGIILWNATDLLDRARELLSSPSLHDIDTSPQKLKKLMAPAPDSWLTVKEEVREHPTEITK